MDLIDEELKEVQQRLALEVESIELVACHRALVTVKVLKTKERELTACIQFPKDYPNSSLLVEIKSKFLTPALVKSINHICDQELKNFLGKKQVFLFIKFLRKFVDENPLLPCRDELTFVKKQLLEDVDVIKMKQKQGIVNIVAKKNEYYIKVSGKLHECQRSGHKKSCIVLEQPGLKFTMSVPDRYPAEKVELKLEDHNFPASMGYYFISQAQEYARQAVEPPLNKSKRKQEFKPSPHVKKILEFLIGKCAKRYPVETCPLCGSITLPEDPKKIVKDGKDSRYAERVYCGHLFHHGCLDKYMKTPPFKDGKQCPKCSLRIYHDKWNISPKLAEDRWAHQEARQRELDEVVDFLS